jgi:hypothetical protein
MKIELFKNRLFFLSCAATVALLAGCGNSSGGGGMKCDPTMPDLTYDPVINPADFQNATGDPLPIDNPLWPLSPGMKTVFESPTETDDVTVTSDTRVIMGVTTVAVLDQVSEDGDITEDTTDYYAQDKDGNVWYFGEDTMELDNGMVTSTAGSWIGGVDGAKPGIVMYAVQPPAGEPYRQEYLVCEAEDMAEVVNTNVHVDVPYGSFDNCLETHEFTPLEPKLDEHKFYCAGVGVVLEVDEVTGDRTELTSVTP